MKDPSIKRLVDEYLDSIPPGVVLSIIGLGTFTREQLRDEFERETPAGERLVQLVLDGSPDVALV